MPSIAILAFRKPAIMNAFSFLFRSTKSAPRIVKARKSFIGKTLVFCFDRDGTGTMCDDPIVLGICLGELATVFPDSIATGGAESASRADSLCNTSAFEIDIHVTSVYGPVTPSSALVERLLRLVTTDAYRYVEIH